MFTPRWWVPSGANPEISFEGQVERRRRENRGAEGVGCGEECPLPTKDVLSEAQGFMTITPSLALPRKFLVFDREKTYFGGLPATKFKVYPHN
jgi:hypothetical protein